jgi:hypothetical protein
VAGSFRIAEGYVEVTADESGYDRAIDRLKSKRTTVKIGVDLDDKDALAKLDRLTRERLATVKLRIDDTALATASSSTTSTSPSPQKSATPPTTASRPNSTGSPPTAPSTSAPPSTAASRPTRSATSPNAAPYASASTSTHASPPTASPTSYADGR